MHRKFDKSRSIFENIIDTIADSNNKAYSGQVTMFDMGNDDQEMQKIKYTFTELKEYSEKELLSMEKEMLGIYISGHPLEKYREKIKEIATVNILELKEANEAISNNVETNIRDGQRVKLVGIITKIKKKFTKTNKIMAFVTVEDLYGSCEVVVFESCYNNCSNLLFEESIVVIDGRVSMKEDTDVSIVANIITEMKNNDNASQNNKLILDITNLDEKHKAKLRGAIKFFAGDKNNMPLYVKQGDKISSCGAIYANEEIIKELKEIVGEI